MKRIVHDEYQQPWVLTPEDGDLYEQASEDTVYPIALLTARRGWGWWSCLATQTGWLEHCGIPVPDHQLLAGLADANSPHLREMLQKFGGYVCWLEAQIGIMEGRRNALKSSYDAAVLVASVEEDATRRTTEKAKEAMALAASETLRQTKRMQIEQDTTIVTAKGLLDAYQRAWETVSRIATVMMTEAELSTQRHV